MARIKELFDKYVDLCEKGDLAACSDLVHSEDDETCRVLYNLLCNDDRTKDKLVRGLWFNYSTQKLRWDT